MEFSPKEQLIGRMQKARVRLTKQRLALANLISIWQRPFTSSEVIVDLQRSGVPVHRATVFRDLDHLVKAGILKEVKVSQEKGRHFVIAHERSGHFLVCERCGKVESAERGEIMPVLKQWSEMAPAAKDWKIRTHEVESYGVCPACQIKIKAIHV